MVSQISARSRDFGFALAGTRYERTAPGRAHPWTSNEMFAATHARSGRISKRLRSPLAQQISPGASLLDHDSWRRKNCQLRAGRIADRNFRRQLELARAGLVPDQLPFNRIAPAVSSLLRRRFQSRMPDWFRALHAPQRSRERTFESIDQDLDAR